MGLEEVSTNDRNILFGYVRSEIASRVANANRSGADPAMVESLAAGNMFTQSAQFDRIVQERLSLATSRRTTVVSAIEIHGSVDNLPGARKVADLDLKDPDSGSHINYLAKELLTRTASRLARHNATNEIRDALARLDSNYSDSAARDVLSQWDAPGPDFDLNDARDKAQAAVAEEITELTGPLDEEALKTIGRGVKAGRREVVDRTAGKFETALSDTRAVTENTNPMRARSLRRLAQAALKAVPMDAVAGVVDKGPMPTVLGNTYRLRRAFVAYQSADFARTIVNGVWAATSGTPWGDMAKRTGAQLSDRELSTTHVCRTAGTEMGPSDPLIAAAVSVSTVEVGRSAGHDGPTR